jgi:hypothetical protein
MVSAAGRPVTCCAPPAFTDRDADTRLGRGTGYRYGCVYMYNIYVKNFLTNKSKKRKRGNKEEKRKKREEQEGMPPQRQHCIDMP